MRARVSIFGLLAFLWSLCVVLIFSPRLGSFWGESFFDIPYSFALWFVPIVNSMLASVSAYQILKNEKCKKNHVNLGLAVAGISFLGYGLIHSVILMFIDSVTYGVYFFGSFIMFGGMVFFPLSIIVAIGASAMGYKLFCPKKAPPADHYRD